ncbi:hypothetical protein SDC9_94638 [bioreactor metagenome]|uniref:Uncharacterized protein n=1 Tax=bioreactor metagenome TaxID=1076179 RepID=A0A645A4C2_9ZZZZ
MAACPADGGGHCRELVSQAHTSFFINQPGIIFEIQDRFIGGHCRSILINLNGSRAGCSIRGGILGITETGWYDHLIVIPTLNVNIIMVSISRQ